MYNQLPATCPLDDKLMAMAERLVNIGGIKIDEPSLAKAAAVAAHTDTTRSALDNTRRLKMFYNAIEKDGKLCGPRFYPSDPGELESSQPLLWLQITDDGGIVPSTISSARACILKAMQPCRSSKGDIAPLGVNSSNATDLVPRGSGSQHASLRNMQMTELVQAAQGMWSERGPPLQRQRSFYDLLENFHDLRSKPTGLNLYNVSGGNIGYISMDSRKGK